jgi:hypothetical protein
MPGSPPAAGSKKSGMGKGAWGAPGQGSSESVIGEHIIKEAACDSSLNSVSRLPLVRELQAKKPIIYVFYINIDNMIYCIYDN